MRVNLPPSTTTHIIVLQRWNSKAQWMPITQEKVLNVLIVICVPVEEVNCRPETPVATLSSYGRDDIHI